MNSPRAMAGAVLLAVAAVAACTSTDSTGQSSPHAPAPTVVIATGMSRSGDTEKHYAECAHDPHAELGEYRVLISADLDNSGLPEGSPCPAGPRELMPTDEHPDLSAELSNAMQAPSTSRTENSPQ